MAPLPTDVHLFIQISFNSRPCVHERLSMDKRPFKCFVYVSLKQAPFLQQARGGGALQERQGAHGTAGRRVAPLLGLLQDHQILRGPTGRLPPLQ